MVDVLLGTYEEIALEYYDSIRHPTCANFREASGYLLNEWLKQIHINGLLCEVGPGKSLLAELLDAQNIVFDRLILIDSSLSMLAYSNQWPNKGKHLILGDALKIPIASKSIELLVSSLGDPYNEYNDCKFWKEVYRVLKPGGISFFTTPSYEWVSKFRSEGDMTIAEFELSDGRSAWVPSWIYPENKQLEIIMNNGLLVKEVAQVSRTALKSKFISPKILIGEPDLSIVTGYFIIKDCTMY